MPIGQSPQAVQATAAFRQSQTRLRQTELAADRLALEQRDFALKESGRRLEEQARRQTLQQRESRQRLFGELGGLPVGAVAPGAIPGLSPIQAGGGGLAGDFAQIAQLAQAQRGGARGPSGVTIAPEQAAQVQDIAAQLVGLGVNPEVVQDFLVLISQGQVGAPPAAPGLGGPAPTAAAGAQPLDVSSLLSAIQQPPAPSPATGVPTILPDIISPSIGIGGLEQAALTGGGPGLLGALPEAVLPPFAGLGGGISEILGTAAVGPEEFARRQQEDIAQVATRQIEVQREREQAQGLAEKDPELEPLLPILEAFRTLRTTEAGAAPVQRVERLRFGQAENIARRLFRELPTARQNKIAKALRQIGREDIIEALGQEEGRTQTGFDLLLESLGEAEVPGLEQLMGVLGG